MAFTTLLQSKEKGHRIPFAVYSYSISKQSHTFIFDVYLKTGFMSESKCHVFSVVWKLDGLAYGSIVEWWMNNGLLIWN